MQLDEAFDERLEDLLVHIDALDAAAALAGIEERAVDEVLDRVVELGVGQHIGRILAAELEAERGEGAGRGALDRLAARDRAGEVDVVDLARADQLLGLGVAEHEVLEEALRQPGLVGRRLKALADEQRLRRVLQEHRVAGHQRREDRVDGGEVRIVPRRDDQHDAERLALHIAAEARLLLRHERRQRLLGDRRHVARALLEPALLAAEAHRPAHLPGELRHDLVVHREQRVEHRDRRPSRARRPARRAHSACAARARDTAASISASVASGRSA